MRSRTLASGAVLLTIFGLSGVVFIQDLVGAPGSDVAVVAPEAETAPSVPTAAPARVVESAGFPAVPARPEEEQPVAATGPTVTLNGRPLDSSWSPVTEAIAERRASESGDAAGPTADVALAAPRPIPRPEGLVLPSAQPAPSADYESITAAAYPREPEPSAAAPQGPQLVGPVGVVGGFLTYEERQRLAMGENPGPGADELVQVIGPNGETLWVYPDQAAQFGYRQPARPGYSPFGTVFD